MDHDDLAIEDGFAFDVQSPGTLGKTFGPVQPVAGEDLPPTAVQMNLDPVAVIFGESTAHPWAHWA